MANQGIDKVCSVPFLFPAPRLRLRLRRCRRRRRRRILLLLLEMNMKLNYSSLKIVVVGAGPAGIILSLLLGKAGIPVVLVDQAEAMDNSPRASHYAAPAVYELRRAGLLDDILKKGFIPNGVAWRDLEGNSLGGINMAPLPQEHKMVCLPLNQMCRIALDHLERLKNVEIKWKYKVKKIDQDETKARIVVDGPNGEETLEADFVVGCDGANSQIRRSLFGDWEFPGTTWDEQIVATNVGVPETDTLETAFLC